MQCLEAKFQNNLVVLSSLLATSNKFIILHIVLFRNIVFMVPLKVKDPLVILFVDLVR